MENRKYQFADDASFLNAANAVQLVIYMRDTSRFASLDTLESYMESFADRYQIDSGNRVRVDSAENFVADLVKFGFLTDFAI